MKAQLRRANSLGARFAVILGDREIDEGVVELKDLTAHSQEKVAKSDVARRLVALLAAVVVVLFATTALAQGAGGGKQGGPTQSSPTRNKPVGPRSAAGTPTRSQQGTSPAVASARRAHRRRADRPARAPRGRRRPHRHRLRRAAPVARGLAPPVVLPVLRGAPRRLPAPAHPAALPRAHARPRPEDRREHAADRP